MGTSRLHPDLNHRLKPDGRLLRWLLALILSTLAFSVSASSRTFSFQSVQVAEGEIPTSITAITQDQDGFLWIGTYDGLYRYDGYQFRLYRSDPRDNSTLSSNLITSLLVDTTGALWVGTLQGGLNRKLPGQPGFVRFLPDPARFDSISEADIFALGEDPEGRIWIGTASGLDLFLPESNSFLKFQYNPLDPQSLPSGPIIAIEALGNGNLWIASRNELALYHAAEQSFETITGLPISANLLPFINSLYIDPQQHLWVATRNQGVTEVSAMGSILDRYHGQAPEDRRLSDNNIRAVLRDRKGNLWFGTSARGLNIREASSDRIIELPHDPADPLSPAFDEIVSLYQSLDGCIWIGTEGGGLQKSLPGNSAVSRLIHSPLEADSLSGNLIWDLASDADGNVWIATSNGLDRYQVVSDTLQRDLPLDAAARPPRNQTPHSLLVTRDGRVWFTSLQGYLGIIDPRDPEPARLTGFAGSGDPADDQRLYLLAEDPQGNVWMASGTGLMKLSATDGRLLRAYPDTLISDAGDPSGFAGSSLVRSLEIDRDGFFWMGTWGQGLLKWHPDLPAPVAFTYAPDQPDSLTNNTIRSLFIDHQNNLWIGTQNGLNLLPETGRRNNNFAFSNFSEADGLPDSVINSIAEDHHGRLWLGTNRGLSAFNLRTRLFTNLGMENGLPADEFTDNAVTRSEEGLFFWGTIAGVAIINPSPAPDSQFTPEAMVTGVLSRSRRLSDNPDVFATSPLVLDYDNNEITFEFASQDFSQPSRTQFAYRLIPYQKNWLIASDTHEAAFTNLDPGHYRFQIRASNADGLINDQITELSFEVLPPWYRTWWAWLVYLLLAAVVILGFYLRHRQKLAAEQEVSNRLKAIDQLKDEFLANTSHELRTPLNGIIGLAESLKSGSAGNLDPEVIDHLDLIANSGRRLSYLVDSILDFKKLSYDSIELHREPINLDAVLTSVCDLLMPLARRKSLHLQTRLPAQLPYILADEDRLQQILYNLVGNALKYTDSGTIEIDAQVQQDEVVISIRDTGIGIRPDDLDAILKPFKQGDNLEAVKRGGTGLGLAISRKLIELHGSKLQISSEPSVGSTFSFGMPIASDQKLSRIDTRTPRLAYPEAVPVAALNRELETPARDADSRPKILVVDDDPVNLKVISGLLSTRGYDIYESDSGETALNRLENEAFDLVILDVMMPRISGITVTRRLRETRSQIELPILLLSAKTRSEDRVAGLDAGANDYINKPVDKDELLSRVRTLLMVHQLLETDRQNRKIRLLDETCTKLKKYFPHPIVERIVSSDEFDRIAARRLRITVLFADLVGFTSISDKYEPETIAAMLDEFIAEMGQATEQQGGLLNEVLGDGLVVLFGTGGKSTKEQQANQSLALAKSMQAVMQKLSDKWQASGISEDLSLRIGIHQDFATVGSFGSDQHLVYRAVGSAMNLAYRIQALANPGEVLLTYPVQILADRKFRFTEPRDVELKGFAHSYRVCRLL